MIIIFDMDDTLYDEFTYCKNSLQAVAKYLCGKYEISRKTIFDNFIQILNSDGRGHIFDDFLLKNKIYSKKEVRKCISVYRKNIPNISLYDEARVALEKLSKYPKYVVSDGNKVVQSIKVNSLGINPIFKKIFLTHYYGIKHAKPSNYCFKLIKRMENCRWRDMVYIGDDPNKDFVNLNPLGMKTIRVHTGRFKNQNAKEGFDAIHSINDLSELNNVLGIT